MTKLHLKRTPAEVEQRARRKAYKAAKRAEKQRRLDNFETETYNQRRKRKYPTSDDDVNVPSSRLPDYDAIRSELEEMRFKEKLWGASEEDERLDGINTRFNDYVHVPDRWARDKYDLADPQHMDDDEYAEWIREGMWKKKHAQEYEEQAKRDAEKAARKTREEKIKAETSRIERLILEKEERRREERQRQREEEHREWYEHQWKALLDPQTHDREPLTFQDIPWPLFTASFKEKKASDNGSLLSVEHITPEAVAAFLLPDVRGADSFANGSGVLRRNRDRLKETLLRFHPDKFEGRLMHRVLKRDIGSVREAVGQVARTLNLLMNEKS